MAIQTTSNLTNSITTLYRKKYIDGVNQVRLYDQIAVPYDQVGSDGKTMQELMQSSTIYVPFLSEMAPETSAISQVADVVPQTLTDTTLSATWTSRIGALQWAQQLEIEAYTDYTAKAHERIGQNASESIEALAIAAALAGSLVTRTAARISLDAGTPSHRASDSIFRKTAGIFQSLRAPGFMDDSGALSTYMAIMHPFCFHDISESGNVDVIGQYLDKGIHLNWELGQIGNFRLVSSPYAKVFQGAGVNCSAGDVDSDLNGAVSPLATTLVTTDNVAASVSYGLFWSVGTAETGDTFYPGNEQVRPISASTYTITFAGSGPNGGLRFAHVDATDVRNNDSVYTILFAGPQSLVKVYATDVGEFGQIVGPKQTGLADQFTSLAWKFYGGYNRWGETRLMRYEVSTSYEA